MGGPTILCVEVPKVKFLLSVSAMSMIVLFTLVLGILYLLIVVNHTTLVLNPPLGPILRAFRDRTQFEEGADTHHDHIHRGQGKSENVPRLALESVSRGAWHCVAQLFKNAA